MTPHETAVNIAEAIMDAIEKRRGIIKDDLIEAARGVIAGNLSGPASGYPAAHYNPSTGELSHSMTKALRTFHGIDAEEKKVYPPGFTGLDIAKGEDKTAGWLRDSNGMRWAAIPPTSARPTAHLLPHAASTEGPISRLLDKYARDALDKIGDRPTDTSALVSYYDIETDTIKVAWKETKK